MFLQWNGCLQQNMAAVCVPSVHLGDSWTNDLFKPLLMQIYKAPWQQPSFYPSYTHSPVLCKNCPHINHCDLYCLPWISHVPEMGVATRWKYWLSQWQTHSTLPCGSGCFSLLISSLHFLASLWSVAAGHITPEALLMGQQAETFSGCIPCSLQSKASLLAWTTACASFCSSASVCFQSSARPQI